MDLMHHHWKAMLGGKSLKFGERVDRMDRVLDIGTGTGKFRPASCDSKYWAIPPQRRTWPGTRASNNPPH
jgi:hypothetical protein